jgi:hypothetical protein
MDADDGRCSFTKPDGERCRARPRSGRPFCFTHDPDSQHERAAACREGGRQRSKRAAVLAAAPDVTLASVSDVTRLIGETVSQVRRGELDAKVANCVFYGASVALRAIQPDETARQVEELRRQVEALRKSNHGHSNGTPHAGGDRPRGGAPAGHGGAAGTGPLCGGPGLADGGRRDAAGSLADEPAPLFGDEDAAPL